MHAALLESVDRLEVVDDVELSEPREGEVRLRVHHCGVCHSDLHDVDGMLPAMVGVPPIDDVLSVPALGFALTGKTLLGCFLGSSHPHRDLPRLLGLWRAGHLDLEAMVTARRPHREVASAFADMRAGAGLRTVLACG